VAATLTFPWIEIIQLIWPRRYSGDHCLLQLGQLRAATNKQQAAGSRQTTASSSKQQLYSATQYLANDNACCTNSKTQVLSKECQMKPSQKHAASTTSSAAKSMQLAPLFPQ